MTGPEARLWNALRELRQIGHHFRRQVPMGPFIVDFACHRAKLVIEVDGDTHFVGSASARDAARDAFVRSQGYSVMRVTNDDVMRNLDGVLAAIMGKLEAPHPQSLPTRGREAGPVDEA
jgi:very-short-patch-repair endonuclease